MFLFKVHKAPTSKTAYKYFLSHNKSGLDGWKFPAKALKFNQVYDYIKFLKDSYDVEISLNLHQMGAIKGLVIHFKYKEEATHLANLCNSSGVKI